MGVDAVEEPVVEEKHEEAISTLAEPAPAVEYEVEKESEETVKPSGESAFLVVVTRHAWCSI